MLRELRESAGLIQNALAVRLGRNQTFVSNVELGIRKLDLVELRDYCEGLGIELRAAVDMWEGRISSLSGSKRKRGSK